jgi:hypothetical protein
MATTDADAVACGDATDRRAAADVQLSEIVERFEDVDWAVVPTVTPAEAATLQQRLVTARDAVREGDDAGR